MQPDTNSDRDAVRAPHAERQSIQVRFAGKLAVADVYCVDDAGAFSLCVAGADAQPLALRVRDCLGECVWLALAARNYEPHVQPYRHAIRQQLAVRARHGFWQCNSEWGAHSFANPLAHGLRDAKCRAHALSHRQRPAEPLALADQNTHRVGDRVTGVKQV